MLVKGILQKVNFITASAQPFGQQPFGSDPKNNGDTFDGESWDAEESLKKPK
jgi:hypothetical protein